MSAASSQRSTSPCSRSARRSCRPSSARCRTCSTTRALVHEAELAILLEPTDTTIQAGCLGNLNARITFHGVSGHSARPWTAENAIEKALDGLRAVRLDRAAPGRDRRAHVHRGGEHHADRGWDRDERDPGSRRGERQLPLRARPLTVERGRLSAQPPPRGRDVRARRRLAARPRRHRLVAGAAPARSGRPRTRAEAGVDERRRLHLPRHRRRQLRARVRPAMRTGGTSRSRSRRWSGRSRALWRFVTGSV